MDAELLALICCPFDHGNLTMRTFVEEQDSQIKEGVLICDCCGRQYPIASGIPRMLPLDLLPLADLEAAPANCGVPLPCGSTAIRCMWPTSGTGGSSYGIARESTWTNCPFQ